MPVVSIAPSGASRVVSRCCGRFVFALLRSAGPIFPSGCSASMLGELAMFEFAEARSVQQSDAPNNRMANLNKVDFAVGIGGENGQGIASTGDILARIFARRGLHLNAYNAYQSIIRGGHTFLTIRASDAPCATMGDKIDVFIPLNQDTMDRHSASVEGRRLRDLRQRKSQARSAADGVQLCPMPMKDLTKGNKLAVNTAALGAALQLLGIESSRSNRSCAGNSRRRATRSWPETSPSPAGYEYAAQNFKAFPWKRRSGQSRWRHHRQPGHRHGRAAAGVKFYAAYPMSPSTGVLDVDGAHARQLGIMVRQVEDEIGVMNMVIGAAHAGCRAMCATAAAALP
jgi:2-oxoglutarate ferredoxin oxidoreductase subunit alpha